MIEDGCESLLTVLPNPSAPNEQCILFSAKHLSYFSREIIKNRTAPFGLYNPHENLY